MRSVTRRLFGIRTERTHLHRVKRGSLHLDKHLAFLELRRDRHVDEGENVCGFAATHRSPRLLRRRELNLRCGCACARGRGGRGGGGLFDGHGVCRRNCGDGGGKRSSFVDDGASSIWWSCRYLSHTPPCTRSPMADKLAIKFEGDSQNAYLLDAALLVCAFTSTGPDRRSVRAR